MLKVTALVCTRNRPTQITKAVRCLLQGADGVELIVVDQSPGVETEQALAPMLVDPRLRYHRTKTQGKGAGLNEGIRMASSPLIVLTDDDCEAPPGWALAMARLFEARPKVAIVFCNVVAVPHDPRAGYVPVYRASEHRLLKSLESLRQGLGLGAGMALRRDVVIELGSFDESFGPGARFPSADEWDISMRALLAGWHIYETPDLSVVHDGFRLNSEGASHARRDWLALGAVCAKPLLVGRMSAAVVPLQLFSKKALWPPIADALHLRLPRGASRITAFIEGFAQGVMTPIDPKTLCFERRT